MKSERDVDGSRCAVAVMRRHQMAMVQLSILACELSVPLGKHQTVVSKHSPLTSWQAPGFPRIRSQGQISCRHSAPDQDHCFRTLHLNVPFVSLEGEISREILSIWLKEIVF